MTIDAMGCQTAIAAQVIERQGDYLLNVKDNQPKLAEAIEEYLEIGEQHAWNNLAPSQFDSLDKGHGRVETRRCMALAVPDYLAEITRWPGIKSIARNWAIFFANASIPIVDEGDAFRCDSPIVPAAETCASEPHTRSEFPPHSSPDFPGCLK